MQITSILQFRAAVPIHPWDELTPPCGEKDGMNHQNNAQLLGKIANRPHWHTHFSIASFAAASWAFRCS